MTESMETMTDAMRRLRSQGYTRDWYARDGALWCSGCGGRVDPSSVEIDEIVRFEGESDPGDQAILHALTGPSSHRGLYSAAYGPSTPSADAAVMVALRSTHR